MTLTADDVELDLTSLTRSLEQLNAEVSASRAGVLDAIRSRGEEFAAASGQMNELQRRVAGMKEDLALGGAPCAPALRPPEEVQQQSSVHGQLSVQLSELDDGIVILGLLLDARSTLARVEGLVVQRSFTEAVNLLQSAAASLSEISAASVDEPGMIQSAKSEYCRLRTSLVAGIDGCFRQLFANSKERRTSKGPAFREVWGLYETLGLKGQRLEQLSCEIRRKLLLPILAGALHWEKDPSEDSLDLEFAWADEALGPQGARMGQPLAEVLELLRKLFGHCYLWAGELHEARTCLRVV